MTRENLSDRILFLVHYLEFDSYIREQDKERIERELSKLLEMREEYDRHQKKLEVERRKLIRSD